MVVRERTFIMTILNDITWEEFCDSLMITLYNMECEHEKFSGLVPILTKDDNFGNFMHDCRNDRLEEYELRKEIEEYWHECLTSA